MNNGVIPNNYILDKVAYITLLTNVPMAIYDANKVNDSFYLGLDNQHHKVLGFDNVERETNENDIIIKSNEQVISIAGCIGAKSFGVDQNTKSIIIEICNFNYINIRNTSKRLNINTDAAKRFSKPMSSFLTSLSFYLIHETFDSIVASKFKSGVIKQISFPIEWDYITSLLGIELKQDMVAKYLQYFGIDIKENICFMPKYRLDVKTSQDLAEEIVKIFDVNEIPTIPIHESLGKNQDNKTFELANKIKYCLLANHIGEVKTYNLTNKNNLDKFNIFNYTKFGSINDTNNNDRAFLRSNLIERMLKVYQLNVSHKNELYPIFELQKIYSDQTYLNLTILSPEKIFIDRLSKSQININTN
jgi:phenylalanyl-tRNA synthetase beta chain